MFFIDQALCKVPSLSYPPPGLSAIFSISFTVFAREVELTGLTIPTRREASVINPEGGKERRTLALCTVGGEIYAWLHLNPWRHKDEEKLLHNLGHLR